MNHRQTGSAVIVLLACGVATAHQRESAPKEAIELFDEAAESMDAEQYEVAVATWKRFLNDYSATDLAPKASLRLGQCHMSLKQWTEARDAFVSAARNSPRHIRDQAVFMTGEAHFANREFRDAIDVYRTLFKSKGDDPPDEKWQALSAFEAARCAQHLSLNSSSAEERRTLTTEAIRYYRHVVEHHPKSPVAPEASKQWTRLESRN